MRAIVALVILALLAACSAPRTYTRATPYPLVDAFACAEDQLRRMDYTIVLADTVGGVLQGKREISGIRESARKGVASATELITVGLAGGKRTRYDELTVFVYMRLYPQGNTLETTAGLLSVAGDNDRSRSRPSDAARDDARAIADRCAPRG